MILKDDFNIELFLRVAKGKGFNIEGTLQFSPHKLLPRKRCICPIKNPSPYAQGFLYDRELYIHSNEEGELPELKKFADDFQFINKIRDYID